MPQYHFNVAGDPSSDTEGTELKDVAEAKCEAVKLAGRLICEQPGDFWGGHDWKLTVSDDSGMILFSLHVIGVDAPTTAFYGAPSKASV